MSHRGPIAVTPLVREPSSMAVRIEHYGVAQQAAAVERSLLHKVGMALFSNVVTLPPYRAKARRELRRIVLELAFERERAEALGRAAVGHPELALKASAAEVRVAALRARAAQLRRAAGQLDPAA
jgi:hypothetical protein